MIVGKWNYKKHDYEPYRMPSDWNCKTYSDDMDEIINCAQCGRSVKFGDCYTSLEIHSGIGFGYGVCENCYNAEFLRKINNK